MEESIQAQGIPRSKGKIGWSILVVAILLSLVTYLATQFIDRFRIETEQLLLDDTFTVVDEVWQTKGSQALEFKNHQLKINNKPGKNQSVFQNIVVDTPAFYQVSFKAGVNNVVPSSPEKWALASVAIIYRDITGERIGSKTLSFLSGTQPIAQFTEDLRLKDIVASIDFAARLYRAGGELILSEPVVARLEELGTYKAMRYVIVTTWAVFLAFIMFTAVKVFRVWQILVLVVMAGVALLGTLMPDAIMTVLTQKLAGLLPEPFLVELRNFLSRLYGESGFSEAGTEVSKLGHFLIFMCFGLFAGLLWRRCGIYYAIAAIFVFSVVTEALQTLVYGRTTNVSDLVLDNAGGLLGLVFGVGLAELMGLFRRVKETPTSEEKMDYYEEDHIDESYRYRNR